MKAKSFSNIFQILFLLICLLYAYIPFESQSIRFTNSIHIIAQFFILIYALYIGNLKVKINKSGRLIIYLLVFLVVIGMIIRSGEDGLLFLISVLFGSLTASVIHYNTKFRRLFLNALKYLIVVSISMLFLQLAIFRIKGEIIDFHKILYPFSSIRIGIEGGFDNFFRMGGIYIEPGTYSNYMYLLLVLFIFISKNTSNPLLMVGAVSIILTYSLWGIIFGLFLLIVLLILNFDKYSKLKKIILLVAFISGGVYLINEISQNVVFQYAITKLDSNDDESVSSKTMAFNRYSDSFEDFLIIGEGFYPKFNEGIHAVQDSGFILNFSVVFGILFTVAIFFIYFRSFLYNNTLGIFIIGLPVFISKIFYYDAVFWLLFFLVIYGSDFYKKKIKIYVKNK